MSSRLRPLRDEDGSATVEAVIWLPLFFAILILITDASLAFYGRAEAFRILENGNRAYAVGGFATDAAAASYIKGQLAPLSPRARVTTTTDAGSHVITTTATIPVNDLLAFGSIDALSGFDMTVRSQHYREF